MPELERRAVLAGVPVTWIAEDSASVGVIERLARDFSAFAPELERQGTSLQFRLRRETRAFESPALSWRWKGARFRGAGARREIWYPNEAECRWRFDGDVRQCSLVFRDPDRGHALAYDALLSALGERLELEGWHRAHGLGLRHAPTGFSALLLLPPGGGKSTLARFALEDPEFELHSDESPLLSVREGRLRIRAFPLRLATVAGGPADGPADERIVRADGSVKQLRGFPPARAATEGPLGLILVGGAGRRAPRAAAAALIVGALGCAQMGEHLLRWDGSGSLPVLLAGRLRVLRAATRIPIAGFAREGGPARTWTALRARIVAAVRAEGASTCGG